MATHSPYFVDLGTLVEGGQLVRVATSDLGTQVFQLSEVSKEAIRRLSEGNLYNPHIFGLDARELFFQEDRIILTEGQEDVLLYPRLAEQVDRVMPVSFFGWGAGGANNIGYLCAIFKDLGFKRVAGILDQDKADEAAKLRNDYPEYFFDCIPAKDIRDKKAQNARSEVVGLLDKDFVLRPEFTESVTAFFDRLQADMNS